MLGYKLQRDVNPQRCIEGFHIHKSRESKFYSEKTKRCQRLKIDASGTQHVYLAVGLQLKSLHHFTDTAV